MSVFIFVAGGVFNMNMRAANLAAISVKLLGLAQEIRERKTFPNRGGPGFPLVPGKVRIVLRTLSGLFPVGAVNRPRKRHIRKIPGQSPDKSGKFRKNRESHKKGKKGRTSPDRESPPVNPPLVYRPLIAAIVPRNSSVLVFIGYRTAIARNVAKWVSHRCACAKRSAKGGLGVVSHQSGGAQTSLKRYRAIWGLAAIVSQYRTTWGHEACKQRGVLQGVGVGDAFCRGCGWWGPTERSTL